MALRASLDGVRKFPKFFSPGCRHLESGAAVRTAPEQAAVEWKPILTRSQFQPLDRSISGLQSCEGIVAIGFFPRETAVIWSRHRARHPNWMAKANAH